ncbi:MAG: hypothetical protein AAB459_02315 [Patescibacteria group bacterium]
MQPETPNNPDLVTPKIATQPETPTSSVVEPQNGVTPTSSEPAQVAEQQTNSEQPSAEVLQPLTNPIGTPQVKKSRSKLLKIIAIIFVAVIVLGGGSAGAYFGIVVPNKPENKLQKALFNSLAQHEITAKGDITVDTPEESLKSTKLAFETQVDTSAPALSGVLEVSVAAVKIKIDVIMVEKNFYFKVGDLKSLLALAQLDESISEYIQLFELLEESLTDKWIEIDDTLLKQFGINPDDCVLTPTLSSDDLKKLEETYTKNRFLNIQSTASEAVDSISSTKYVLKADETKSKEFEKVFKELSVAKQLEKCSQPESSEGNGLDQEVKKDDEPLTNYEMSIWVDNSASRINKFEFKAKDGETSGSISAKISYKAIEIKKPEGAIPAITLFSQLQQSFLNTFGPEELPTDVQGWSTLIPSSLLSD